MKSLLEKDFVYHYNKNKEKSVVANVTIQTTTDGDFELKDDDILIYPPGKGIAKYKNSKYINISVINYENYVKSLPDRVKNAVAVGKDICDLIVYSQQHFLLNELTDTKSCYIGVKRIKAQSQLLQTLQILLKIPSIRNFANTHAIKQCCFFSKQENPEFQEIEAEAINTFNRQNTYSHGFKSNNSDIEALGFEFWEFYSNQTYLLSSTNLESIAKQLTNLSPKKLKKLTEIIHDVSS
jgi:hypothetical protein